MDSSATLRQGQVLLVQTLCPTDKTGSYPTACPELTHWESVVLASIRVDMWDVCVMMHDMILYVAMGVLVRRV